MLVFENPLKARLLGPQFLVHMLGILGYPIWVFRDEKSPIDNDDTRNTRRLQLLKVGCFYAPGTGFRWTKKTSENSFRRRSQGYQILQTGCASHRRLSRPPYLPTPCPTPIIWFVDAWAHGIHSKRIKWAVAPVTREGRLIRCEGDPQTKTRPEYRKGGYMLLIRLPDNETPRRTNFTFHCPRMNQCVRVELD